MKNFHKSGTCNTEELELLFSEILDCIKMANFINVQDDLKNNIKIDKLNLNFEDNIYNIQFDYYINYKDDEDDEETTFDGLA